MRSIYTIFLFCYLTVFSIGLKAQHSIKRDPIFKAYSYSDQSHQSKASQSYLIKFKSYPNEEILKNYGMIKAISSKHFIVSKKNADASFQMEIEYLVPANGNWKATDQLLKKLGHIKSKDSLLVQAKISGELVFCSRKKTISSNGIVLIKVRKADWSNFINQSNVEFVDLLGKPKEESIINTLDLTLNRVRTLQSMYPNLNGAGIRVSLKENLFDTTDIDLTGKYIPSNLTSNTISSHATIMATIIGGAGNSYISGKGVAPQILLSSSDFKNLNPDQLSDFQRNGISIQNHSYGTGIENYYGIEAAAYDKLIAETDTLIHIFSSGNIGDGNPTDGLYKGLAAANLSGTFKQAKNVLVVGGTNATNEIETLSSRGPAYDGRVKPELVAYGEEGTSGAAAIVSGVCALLQEQYQQLYKQKPSSALLRTILINSADDVGKSNVDFLSGFGALNAIKAVANITENHFFTGSINNNNEQSYQINLPDKIKLLKVTLTWNDPAAPINNQKALVNNLDLWLEDPNGKKYLPWGLSTYPNIDSLLFPAVRKRDDLNTIEQATVENPASGTYTLHIKGTSISSLQQSFAIAYQTELMEHFEWDFPKAADQLKAGDEIKLRWSTSIVEPANIYYSLDDGLSWESINNSVETKKGYYSWSVPKLFSKTKLKMQIGGKSFISDSFSISTPLNIYAGFNCPDSAMLYWKAQPGATAYRIYSLSDNALKVYTQTTDTLLIIEKDKSKDECFAVSAIGSEGWQGLKGYTSNYTSQGLQCHIQQLLADKTADNTVQLLLQLGSLYNLKKITWERQATNEFVPLGETEIQSSANYVFTDESPLQGIHNYRVRIETINGSFSYSDPIAVTILESVDLLVFPNPVQSTLNILSRSLEEMEFKLIDVNGKFVLQQKLNNLLQPIQINDLVPGNYFYVILKKGKKVNSGKLIKQ